jgi:hypothetical protein
MESHANDFGINVQELNHSEVKPLSTLSAHSGFGFQQNASTPVPSLELVPGGCFGSFPVQALQVLKGGQRSKVSSANFHVLQPQLSRHEVAVNTYDLQLA